MQIVRQERKTFAGTELTIDSPPSGNVAPPADAPPVTFSVAYTLREYMSILRAHIRFMLRHMPAAQRSRQTWLPVVLGTGAALIGYALGPGWGRNAFAVASALSFLSLPFMLNLWVALVAPPVFLLKKRRMPVCAFRIDGRGIARTSRLGTFERSWEEVKMVRCYRRGYLLMFASGGIPLPFRCLDEQQQERLRTYITSRGLVEVAN